MIKTIRDMLEGEKQTECNCEILSCEHRTREDKILALRKKGVTQESIAKTFGISRQRVQTILEKERERQNRVVHPPCSRCISFYTHDDSPYCEKGETSDMCGDFSCFRPRV